MAHDDDDRPKKSWREKDRQKDSSSHRQPDRSSPQESRQQSSQAYRSYKTQLNKLFDGGAVPDALKSTLGDVEMSDAGKKKKELLKALVEARLPKEIRAALKAYRVDLGFPEDEEALAKLLDLDDEEIVLETLEKLSNLLDEGSLKKSSSFKARVKTAQMTVDDPDVHAAAAALLRRL